MKKGTETQDEEIKSVQTPEEEVSSLREQIGKLEAEINEMKDQYIRKYADFENFRKRILRDKEDAVKYANTSLLGDLVGILDDFERAGTSSREAKDIETVINGVQMIEKQMLSLLEKKWGLKKFAPLNEPFDPEKHEALMMAESPDVSEATVAEVYQNGYILNDRIIRHAKVKVSMPAKKENE